MAQTRRWFAFSCSYSGSAPTFSSLSPFLHFVLASILSIRCLTHCQPQPSFVPIPVSYSAFARTVNKLYVAGGAKLTETGDFGIPQFIYLDLSMPWSTASPAWTKLADGPIQDMFPAVFSVDEQALFAFHIKGTNSPWMYSVLNNTWQELTAKFQNAALSGLGAVTDPRTGLIYISGGFEDASYDAPYPKYMDIFDSVTKTIHTIEQPDPTDVFPVRLFYGNVWSKHLNSILYWGGVNKFGEALHSPVQNGVTKLTTDTMTWSTLATTGTAPEVRDGHCMTTNEDGTKVVIIGGQLRNKTVVGDLWVLDLLTATWSQGLSGPIRANAVCTIAGDQVIIWGGRNSSTSDAPSEMLIYDLKTSIYVKQYSAPAFYKDLRPPPAPTRTTALWPAEESALINGVQKRSSVPVGAAIGGALGGIVLIGAVAGLCFGQQRRRRQQKQTERHRIESGIFKGLGGLLGRARGRRSRKMLWRNNPQETHDDEILERTLRELEERDKKLEDRKRQLSQKRQLLVLQHQQSISRAPLNEKRGPTAVVDPTTESMFPLPPTSPHQPIPEPVLYSPEDLNDRRTVQAVFTPPGIMSLRESDLAQDTIEPVYGPSPEVNFDIPDLVYVPPPNVGMDWTKQRLGNPHVIFPTPIQY